MLRACAVAACQTQGPFRQLYKYANSQVAQRQARLALRHGLAHFTDCFPEKQKPSWGFEGSVFALAAPGRSRDIHAAGSDELRQEQSPTVAPGRVTL